MCIHPDISERTAAFQPKKSTSCSLGWKRSPRLPTSATRHVLLTIMASVISAAIGFVFNILLNKTTKESKIIKVSVKSSGNILNITDALGNKIGYKFFLPKDPNKTINSYYQYTITILNDGGSAINDIPLLIEIPNKLSLVKEPILGEAPEKVELSFLHVSHDEPYKDELNIKGFVNHGERFYLTYISYSEEFLPFDYGKPKVVVRKQDWTTQYVSEIGSETKNTQNFYMNLFAKNVSDYTGRDVFLMAGVFVFPILLYFLLALFLFYHLARRGGQWIASYLSGSRNRA